MVQFLFGSVSSLSLANFYGDLFIEFGCWKFVLPQLKDLSSNLVCEFSCFQSVVQMLLRVDYHH